MTWTTWTVCSVQFRTKDELNSLFTYSRVDPSAVGCAGEWQRSRLRLAVIPLWQNKYWFLSASILSLGTVAAAADDDWTISRCIFSHDLRDDWAASTAKCEGWRWWHTASMECSWQGSVDLSLSSNFAPFSLAQTSSVLAHGVPNVGILLSCFHTLVSAFVCGVVQWHARFAGVRWANTLISRV